MKPNSEWDIVPCAGDPRVTCGRRNSRKRKEGGMRRAGCPGRGGAALLCPGRVHTPAGATALEPPIPSPMDVFSIQPCRHVAQPTPARVTKNPKPIPPKHLGSRYTLLGNNTLKWPQHLAFVYGHLPTGLAGWGPTSLSPLIPSPLPSWTSLSFPSFLCPSPLLPTLWES